MKNIIIKKVLFLLAISFLLFSLNINIPITSIKFFISSTETNNQKFWVGENHKIIIKKFPYNSEEKIFFKKLNNNIVLSYNNNLLMKSNGRECLTAYTNINRIHSTKCFVIYNTPKLIFQEKNPLKIETNSFKYLNLQKNDYPKSYIKYKSNHPEIIKINDKGKIIALRPGRAIITAWGLDNINTQINVTSICNNGLLTNDILDINYAQNYNNLMIVSHPDDETLWGGANIFKGNYFIICLTNGYNLKRANDFTKILKFTKNSGIILKYPDVQDNIRDNWSEVSEGIKKDLYRLISYKKWNKIVTHGPDGTTGNPHHIKTCEFVTEIAKQLNKFNILYYFGKFYPKNEVPNYLQSINSKDLKIKKREVSIYKSVKKTIHRYWFHFLQYENWILASKWKET